MELMGHLTRSVFERYDVARSRGRYGSDERRVREHHSEAPVESIERRGSCIRGRGKENTEILVECRDVREPEKCVSITIRNLCPAGGNEIEKLVHEVGDHSRLIARFVCDDRQYAWYIVHGSQLSIKRPVFAERDISHREYLVGAAGFAEKDDATIRR